MGAAPMTDFVSGLREELVSAAARRERRALPVRPLVPVLPVAALVAAIVLVAALLNQRPTAEDDRSVAPRTGDARPLFGGTLQPGVRYGTVALVPAVTFEVGDERWIADGTENDTFLVLVRQEPRPPGRGQRPPPRGFVGVGRFPLVLDPARPGAATSASPAPADFAGWLRAHPDVDAGRPRPTRLAGLEGVVLDLTYRFARPAHPAPECRFRDFRCTALRPGDWHRDGARARVWVLDSEPGPLVIAVEAIDPAAFGDLTAAAQPVLDSLELTRP
jgi:hypothetical protein